MGILAVISVLGMGPIMLYHGMKLLFPLPFRALLFVFVFWQQVLSTSAMFSIAPLF